MDAIRCEDCLPDHQIRALVREHGSPLLVLDCALVRVNYLRLRAALPGVVIHYAVKALPHPEVLASLNDEGCSFDAASSGEVQLLRECGVRPENTMHTHPVKTQHEIREALGHGCTSFVVDNEDELKKFTPFRRSVGLLVRLGFPNLEATVDLSKKFGADPADAVRLVRLAVGLGLNVRGFSFHVGSQCSSPGAHVRAIEACRQLMVAVEEAGLPALRVLDIGGGFPVAYDDGTPEIETFCRPIREALEKLPPSVQVISEPGRYLVASAAHSVSQVVGRARRGSRPWYYVDDGVYGSFLAQVFDGIRYPLTVLTANTGPSLLSMLAGPTCDSGDMLAEGILLPELALGDLVIGHMMGAYTSVTATDFNLVKKAKILVLNGPPRIGAISEIQLRAASVPNKALGK